MRGVGKRVSTRRTLPKKIWNEKGGEGGAMVHLSNTKLNGDGPPLKCHRRRADNSFIEPSFLLLKALCRTHMARRLG